MLQDPNLEQAIVKSKRDQMLSTLNDQMYPAFGPYFAAKDWKGLKRVVGSVVSINPDLKCRKITGNAGFIALVRMHSELTADL